MYAIDTLNFLLFFKQNTVYLHQRQGFLLGTESISTNRCEFIAEKVPVIENDITSIKSSISRVNG